MDRNIYYVLIWMKSDRSKLISSCPPAPDGWFRIVGSCPLSSGCVSLCHAAPFIGWLLRNSEEVGEETGTHPLCVTWKRRKREIPHGDRKHPLQLMLWQKNGSHLIHNCWLKCSFQGCREGSVVRSAHCSRWPRFSFQYPLQFQRPQCLLLNTGASQAHGTRTYTQAEHSCT